MVWIETPTTFMKFVDIKAIADMVHKINPKCIVVVDSTLATPIYQVFHYYSR